MSEAEWKAENAENKTSQVEIPEILPLLPIRDIVIYPYMMLPLFVSYDHRVIDGASAARFTAYLAQVIADMRRVVL